jgi:hypothetical protein
MKVLMCGTIQGFVVYELTAAPVRKMQIWTSPEGLLLAADRPGTPKSRIALVRFQQVAGL